MNKIYLRACWLVVLIAFPFLANAAGLGKLTLGSSLGQPLRAEVELVSVRGDEISSLVARVASPEAFRQAGVTYAPYHSSLAISVEKRANGQPYIQITSPQSINEPFLNLLIELNWSSGRLLREYTVLLDPVDNKSPEPASPVVSPIAETAVSDVSSTKSAAQQVNQTKQKSRKPIQKANSINVDGDTYGPVVKGDTLTRIARQVTPDGVDLNQMLVALYRANRGAFFEKNMNLLKVGTILRIPDQNEVSAITRKEANHEVKAQISDWKNYRQRIATAGTDASTRLTQRQELKQTAAGKITTTVEEPKLKQEDSPTEVLILSKGEQLGEGKNSMGKSDSSSPGPSQDYVRMMEEDAIAKDRALSEANERVTMLEHNIERLQRLLEIKNAGLADMQKQAEQAPISSEPLPQIKEEKVVTISKSADEPVMTQEPPKTEESELQSDLVTVPSLPPPATVQNNNQMSPPPPAPAEPEIDIVEQALAYISVLVDFVTENIEIVGGVLISLLTGWLGISFVRRRKEQANNTEEDIGFTEAKSINEDETNESFSSALSANASHLDKSASSQEVFPSSEASDADVHKGSGQDLSPTASGFFFGKNTDESLIPNHSNDAVHQAQFGEDEKNSQSTEAVDAFKFDMGEMNQNSTQSENVAEQKNEFEQFFTPKDTTSHQDFILDFSSDQSHNAQAAPASHDMDFHLDIPEDTNKASTGFSGKFEANEPITQSFDDQLNKLNLTDIKLDLEEDSSSSEKSLAQPESAVSEWQEEVATKIDLAKAYLEMDDKQGAKEILEEVLKEGNDEQQARARAMLDELLA